MASLKTVVRELGVVYWTDRILQDEIKDPSEINPDEFYSICEKHLGQEVENASNLKGREKFYSNKVSILKNAFWLSKRLIEVLEINEIDNIDWIGPETQSEVPLDLIINGNRISLKEDSYILENMGLYQYVNIMTDSDYSRGTWHIFEDFAEEKYESWFETAWRFLLNNAKEGNSVVWKDSSKNYKRRIEVEDEIRLIYKDRESTLPVEKLSISQYADKTIGKTRELFGKWLNEHFLEEEASEEQVEEYEQKKRSCALEAADNLIDYVNDNKDLKYANLLRLLQVYEKSYIYAKAAGGEAKIYRVDSLSDYEYEKLKIGDISRSIPESQVNIVTTIRNGENNRTLKLRNEVRFSHRQFNGTPEAKLYLVEDQSLGAVYQEIDRFEYSDEEITGEKQVTL